MVHPATSVQPCDMILSSDIASSALFRAAEATRQATALLAQRSGKGRGPAQPCHSRFDCVYRHSVSQVAEKQYFKTLFTHRSLPAAPTSSPTAPILSNGCKGTWAFRG